MGDVLDAVSDFVSDTWDAVKDFAETVWDSVIAPVLEEVFSWFGIEDETIVEVQKISTKLYETATDDMYRDAIIRTVLAMPKNDAGFFRNYMQQVYLIKGQMKSWYIDGERGSYYAGLPDMIVSGGNIDFAAVQAALDTELGVGNTLLTADSTFPSEFIWFAHEMQPAPYFYQQWTNTLTYPDQNGVDVAGWTWDDTVYNAGPDTYDILISRDFDETKFWIEGPESIREEDSGTYWVKCNRPVLAGNSVDVALVYSGTAVDGTDYTAVASVTLLENNSAVSFQIDTLDNVSGNPDLTITIGTITDNGPSFDYRTLRQGFDSVTTVIKDNDSVVLTIPDVYVDETAGNATVTVKLEEAATGAFTVDADTQNGTALGTVDFTPTTANLSFAGTADEEQTFTVPILTDAENDDNEYFDIVLSNCSDPGVIITQTGRVWISDGTAVDPAPGIGTSEQVITMPNWNQAEAYLITTYHPTANPPEEWYFWLYRLADGTYADIEPYAQQISNLEMMPIGVLRKDKVNLVDTDPEWDSTKRLLQRLGLKLEDVLQGIEDNPDSNIVDDAYINFAISPLDAGQELSKIMYEQFKTIIVDYGITSNINKYTATIEEGDVNNAMVWSHHHYESNILGKIQDTFTYSHEIVLDASDDDGTHTRLYLRYQKSDNYYDEIYLSRLGNMTAIDYQGYHKVAFNALTDVDTNFTIPVSWFILDKISVEEIVRAYPKMLRLDLNAIQIIELEWYETEAFWDLFSFVAIVVTVITAGAAGGFFAVLLQLAVNYLIIELVIWVAEQTGNEFLAAVVGVVAAIALGSIGAMPALDFSSATDLIQLSTKFADNLTMAYQVEMQEIGQDLEELNRAAEVRLDEIQETMDSYKSPIDTEWLVALQSQASNMYLAIDAQYDFEQIYSYDRLIKNYHSQKLTLGVV